MTEIYDRLGVDRLIQNVAFGPDQVLITYMTVPEDVRETGLVHSHQLAIPVDEDCDYLDEVEALMVAATALLNDALEDLTNLPPYDPQEQDDDDDDDDEE